MLFFLIVIFERGDVWFCNGNERECWVWDWVWYWEGCCWLKGLNVVFVIGIVIDVNWGNLVVVELRVGISVLIVFIYWWVMSGWLLRLRLLVVIRVVVDIVWLNWIRILNGLEEIILIWDIGLKWLKILWMFVELGK